MPKQKRVRKTYTERLREYERLKRQLTQMALSPAEYEEEIRALAERLRI